MFGFFEKTPKLHQHLNPRMVGYWGIHLLSHARLITCIWYLTLTR